MQRFFIVRDEDHTHNPWTVGTELDLMQSDAAHITRVLRLKPGQSIVVCDGQAFDYGARLVRVTPGSVRARVTSVQPSAAEPHLSLTLVQGIAKGSNMDLIVQKAVELGVARIIPTVTERTVVQLDGKRADSRVERWQRIAYEAAKQARRGRVPVVETIHTWSDLWQRDDLGFVIVPWEEEAATGLLQALAAHRAQAEAKAQAQALAKAERTLEADAEANAGAHAEAKVGDNAMAAETEVTTDAEPPVITIAIGPEGGLTKDEVDLARRQGAQPVTLGPRILRTETAAIAATALVLAAFGEMGD